MNNKLKNFIDSIEQNDKKKKNNIKIYVTGGNNIITKKNWKTQYGFKNLLYNWKFFLEYPPKNKKINYKKFMIENMKPFYHIYTKYDIFNFNEKGLLIILIDELKLKENYNFAIKNLFIILKKKFEDLYLLFIKNNTHKNNLSISQIKKLLKIYIKNNKINTSSEILYLINKEKLILNQSLNYSIKNKNTVKKKLNKFNYYGFCPKEPTKRIIKLLNFPFDEIENGIKLMKKNYKKTNFSSINKKINFFIKKTNNINKLYNKNNITSNITDKNKIITKKKIESLLEKLISLYQKLIQIETYYDNLSLMLSDINIALDKISFI